MARVTRFTVNVSSMSWLWDVSSGPLPDRPLIAILYSVDQGDRRNGQGRIGQAQSVAVRPFGHQHKEQHSGDGPQQNTEG